MNNRGAASLLWIPLVALSTWAGVWWQTDLTRWRPETAAMAQSATVSLRTAWRGNPGAVDGVALDPSGSYAGVVGTGGLVRIFDAANAEVGRAVVGDADALVLTGPGNLAAAFRRGDASRGRISFLRLDGSDYYAVDTGEAITDVFLSDDGSQAACGTEEGHIYSVSLDEKPSYRRFDAPGRPIQVWVAPDGAMIAVATADPPGVYGYTTEGHYGWKVPNSDGKGTARFFPSPDGRFLACVLLPSAAAGAYQSRLVVMSAGGRQQWGARIRAADPCVEMSADGRYAAVTYTREMAAGEQAVRDRKVALFETETADAARSLWSHGGPFYDPRLVAMAADGSFVATRDGSRGIYFFGTSGQELWRHRMPSPIRATHASADGRTLLVHCQDGSLTLMTVAGP